MSQNIHYVTDATFDPEVLQSQTPVLVTTGPNGAARAR